MAAKLVIGTVFALIFTLAIMGRSAVIAECSNTYDPTMCEVNNETR